MQNRLIRQTCSWLLIGLLLGCGAWMLFAHVGEDEFGHGDEPRHGINAYEMAQSGNYIVTTFEGEPDYWNLKPPLSTWSMLLGYKVFGYNALGMRFYSPASMFGVMVILAVWLRRRYGTGAAVLCQLFLIACTVLYRDHFARYGDADAQLVLFYTIAMLCMMESCRDPRWLYGSALCFGLAFMTKSWHAVLIPLTCFVFVCVTGVIRRLRVRHYLLLIFFGLLPILPWALLRVQYDGLTFFRKALSVDVVKRATTVVEGHTGEWYAYLKWFKQDKAILLALGLSALTLLAMAIRRKGPTRDQWGAALWFAVPMVFYSLCVSKLLWYVCVCVPSIALLLAMNWSVLRDAVLQLKWKKFACAALAVIFLASSALLGLWGVQNARNVAATQNTDEVQLLLERHFDRSRNPGERVYVDYEVMPWWPDIDYKEWIFDEQVCALLLGDVSCQYGGLQAFEADEERAWLIAHQSTLAPDTLDKWACVDTEGAWTLLHNGR